MNIIINGAKELGLQSSYINKLENIKTQKVSPVLRAVAYNYLFFVTMLFKLKLQFISKFISNLLWATVYSRKISSIPWSILSESITLIILLPGSIMGLLTRFYFLVTKTPVPPMLRNLKPIQKEEKF